VASYIGVIASHEVVVNRHTVDGQLENIIPLQVPLPIVGSDIKISR